MPQTVSAVSAPPAQRIIYSNVVAPDANFAAGLKSALDTAADIARNGFKWDEDGIALLRLCDIIYRLTPEAAEPREFMLSQLLLLSDGYNWGADPAMLQAYLQLWWSAAGQKNLRQRGLKGTSVPAGTPG